MKFTLYRTGSDCIPGKPAGAAGALCPVAALPDSLIKSADHFLRNQLSRASAPCRDSNYAAFAGGTGCIAGLQPRWLGIKSAANESALRFFRCGFRFNPAGCSEMKPAGIPI
jgi:hypothetical protein